MNDEAQQFLNSDGIMACKRFRSSNSRSNAQCRIPRGQEKFLCVVDLKGWGYSNCDIRAYIAAIEIMQVCHFCLRSVKLNKSFLAHD
jgi:hypothetical protein